MQKRTLGKSGIEVSAIGMGCWAIGGPWTFCSESTTGETIPGGWGNVDDAESIRAIHKGLDLGINFFDTAANYGSGHSERLLGKAIAGRRDRVVIATKFGYLVNEDKRTVVEDNAAVVGNIRQDCENSLRRLNTDVIDLYQFHANDYPADRAGEVRDVLEDLVTEGKIRAYGWSTDHVDSMRVFATGEHCAAVQHRFNMFQDQPEMLALCDEFDLASINRGPLLMGVLTGKFNPETTFPENDVRRNGFNFKEGVGAELLQVLDNLREVLTEGGRMLAQAALGWLLARSPRTVPIPGFKTIAQVEDNAGTLALGPLSAAQMRQIDEILGRAPGPSA
jgi:aryl-alcohol dehydrogenase-like predicted oxidoreductase